MIDFFKWFFTVFIWQTNVQPKELYEWEEIETYHESYFARMTVVEMQHHEH